MLLLSARANAPDLNKPASLGGYCVKLKGDRVGPGIERAICLSVSLSLLWCYDGIN